MNPLPIFAKTDAYLHSQFTRSTSGTGVRSPGPFVTVSREASAGGTSLARALAERLPAGDEQRPWELHSGDLIGEMLRTNQLPPELARFLPEDRVSEIEAAVGELVGLHPSLWLLVGKTNELIRELARAGHAVLLGRGANFATRTIAHGVHVRLVAPVEWRAARTARLLSINRSAAAEHNAQREAARARYVRATFGANIADPTEYDLVINSAQVPVDTAVDLIAGFVRAHQCTAATLAARE
jgi:hypothetical protein